MTRIFASTACALAIAIAAPACAQSTGAQVNATVPGEGVGTTATVNRAIPGTPSSPGTPVNPAAPGQVVKPRIVGPTPLLRDGLYAPGTPSLAAANRPNGTVGQEGVSGINPIRGVRPVGAPPLNQHVGVDRP